ncbi:hypothetical protein BD770DRAFT_415639 [Pilaira anomala]|nr:hypothetical protein BD770DRAFT_415639 [Pilaira anomala]
MAGSVVMTGVAMIGVALTNTGAALVVVVMMFLTLILQILLFVVCWNLKSKGQNGCCYDERDLPSGRTKDAVTSYHVIFYYGTSPFKGQTLKVTLHECSKVKVKSRDTGIRFPIILLASTSI